MCSQGEVPLSRSRQRGAAGWVSGWVVRGWGRGRKGWPQVPRGRLAPRFGKAAKVEATRGTGVHSAGHVLVSFQLCLRITLPGLPGLEQSHAPKARLQSVRRATRRPPPCQQSPHRETHGGRVPAGCTLVNTISFNPRGSPTCKGGATVPLYRCTNRTSCQD